MSMSRETVMAFIDGELPAAESARVEAEIARDPALQKYVAQQKALRAHLAHEFAPLLEEPVPQAVEDAVLEVPLAKRTARRARGPAVWWGAGALAAGLAAGLLIAPTLNAPDIVARNATLIAEGALAHALSTQLAATQGRDTPVRIAVTFRNLDGNICRSFTARDGNNALAGIACRENNAWHVAALDRTGAAAANTYQPAAAPMPAGVRASLDAMIAGAPFNAAEERAARTAHWHPPPP